jgi:hypothetical protein
MTDSQNYFYFFMTDSQNFCDKILSRTIKIPHDIHVKNSNVGLEIYKTWFTDHVS